MAARIDHVRASKIETWIHWGVWVPCISLPFWHMYQISNRYFHQLHPGFFSDKTAILNERAKDISDGEWTFWRQFFGFYVCICVISAILSNLTSSFSLLARKISLITVSFIALSVVLGIKGFSSLLTYTCIVYIVAKTRHVGLIWAVMLAVTYAINYEPFQSKIVAMVADEDTAQSLFIFSVMMSNLRLLSFALENAKLGDPNQQQPCIIDFLAYIFYFPLFLNGPIFPFDKFNAQIKKRVEKPIFLSLLLEVLSCMLYFAFIEISYHFFYSASISKHSYILEELNCWETLGIIWTQLQFFYVKYVVFYRFAGVFVKIDGMDPPGQPGCISNLYTFVDMWRYFDKGLYAFLKRYIYIPLGGSQNGLFWQIIASFLSFGFVGYWHGGTKTYIAWAFTNWLGVTMEGITAYLLTTVTMKNFKKRISQQAYRRICAAFGSVTVCALILSNMVFLTGIDATLIYIDRLFVHGCPRCACAVLIGMYCGVQCIIDARLS